MRTLLFLLPLFVAGPAFGQSMLRSDRTATRSSLGQHAAAETAQPVAAVYSWVDEVDGRFVAAPHDGYQTPEQRTAWAAGDDAPTALHSTMAPVAAPPRSMPPAAQACDVLKCLRPGVLDIATSSDIDPDTPRRVLS